MEGSGFGGLFGDPDELQRRLGEFAEQMQGAQRLAWADNAIKLAVDLTVAAMNRANIQGTTEQQAEQLRSVMATVFPEAVTLVREAREGLVLALPASSPSAPSTRSSCSAGLTLRKTSCTTPSASITNVDALHAHVRPAVHRLLDPHPVRLGDRVVLVGEQREAEVELLVERGDPLRRVRRDAEHDRVGAARSRQRWSRTPQAWVVQPGVSALG